MYHILHTNRSLRVDGVVKVVLRNLAHPSDGGFRHSVCSLVNEDHLAGSYRELGFEPVFIGHRGFTTTPRSLWRLLRMIKERRVDLVHTNRVSDLMLAGAAAKLRGIPVVASLHWLAADEDGPRPSARPWQGARRLITVLCVRWLSDRVVAVSEAVRNSFSRERLFPRARVDVVYPGLRVDDVALSDASARQRTRAELGLLHAQPLILNVGRLDPVKGQRYLIPMMQRVRERLPDAVLIIAGGGELQADLERAIAQEGLHEAVRLLGSRSDVDRLLHMSDVLVLASESEAAPLPLLEAMRAAKPIVATRVGGVPEMVRDGVNGFVVPSRDPTALADALVRMFGDDRSGELAAKMGAAGRRIVKERFEISGSVRALERIYRELLEPESAGSGRT